MGGRGASSGNGSKVMKNGKAIEVYLSREMQSKKTVLVAFGEKEIYMRPASYSLEDEGVAGKPAGTVLIKHGIVKGKVINMDLTKAKTISGQTYEYKEVIKANGFKWSPSKKIWYNERLSDKEKLKYLY